MKARMATRFRATYPGGTAHTPTFWGTCPTWAAGFPPSAVVIREPVMVVNPTFLPCGVCRGAHANLPAPSNA